MQITYRETFEDPRLAVFPEEEPFKSLTGADVDLLWTPDTFFRNSVEEETLGALTSNSYARVHPDGTVIVSRRIKLKAACPHLGKDLKLQGKAKCILGIASCKLLY